MALLGIMTLLFGVMAIYPAEGIEIGGIKLQFPSVEEFFDDTDPREAKSEVAMAELLADTTVVLSVIDSVKIQRKLDSIREAKKKLLFVEESNPPLNNFFKVLETANKRKVRVMHYGDSQIECDRITGYIRNELQKAFSGSGGGLFPIVQVSPKQFVNTTYSENWKRYSGFGRKDTAIKHMKYGALMNFSRFAPLKPVDSVQYEGWVTISKPRRSYQLTKTYQQLKIYYGNVKGQVTYQVLVDGKMHLADTLVAGALLDKIYLELKSTPEEIKVVFRGNDSPDIYGISLEGTQGIVVDNIPLRGSSGTLFKKQNRALLSAMFEELAPSLILLEFGGNTVPYIKSQEECLNYGRWFKSQITMIKRMNPEATIILIGPSDMSIKVKTEYYTHPYLTHVRDVLKEAARESNCMFWDMYEAMGGLNSILAWIDADPPLAAPDYTHLTSKGARKISKMFYEQLMDKYATYKNSEATKSENNAI